MNPARVLIACVVLGGVVACGKDPTSPTADTAAAACHAKGDFIGAMHHHVCSPSYAAEMELLAISDPDCKLTFGGKHIRVRCPVDAGADAPESAPRDATDGDTDQ